MKIDKTKLKTATIEDLQHDLKEIQNEFENDTPMQPLSYARRKEFKEYRKAILKELSTRIYGKKNETETKFNENGCSVNCPCIADYPDCYCMEIQKDDNTE